MKKSTFFCVLVCFLSLILFSNCSSAPPPLNKLLTKHTYGSNKLLYVFTLGCAALILTDPNDIEKVLETGLENYGNVESLFFNEGNLGPIIVRESGGIKNSVAVFSIPKDIAEVMVVGFKTIWSSGVNYLWTQEPWKIIIDHDDLVNQTLAYSVRWNGRTTLTMDVLLPSEIDQIYSRAATYGMPWGNKVQPGFIPRR